ncbi:DUF5313 family protein [Actinophytocola glycyrrhizae]|uniref:DUF5313 family protein n=1 Tax=Actinophytocola glycyrrhizae TaxID=2044873 RepID=A0ABV9S5D1_9PSEU
MDMTRPGPVQWVRYAYGARLPDRYREWVLHDATDRGWLARFALRVAAQTLPWLVAVFVVLVLFTPLPVGWVLGAIAMALGLSLYFTVTSADELTEARLVKHGYAPGTGKKRRKDKHVSQW